MVTETIRVTERVTVRVTVRVTDTKIKPCERYRHPNNQVTVSLMVIVTVTPTKTRNLRVTETLRE